MKHHLQAILAATGLVSLGHSARTVSGTIDPRSAQCGTFKFYDTTMYECYRCGNNAIQDPNDSKLIFKCNLTVNVLLS